ncbi:hypothetical protein [Caproiciproducens sp. MSJ-32]|uniref:hypothetical protein n=1 Tax=Caproiciproducens sp. MSJ-32 TaxID=2841527 RepID=UPI001C10FE56|nr:hypothetical protein [Caproiciproducens sp. MSJ-32]MBU5456091.1 hypothetical protein [Caproiciproducens sp. MSJ-32]
MFKVHFIEMFIRAIPEQTLLVIGSYILSRTKLNVKKALLSGIIMGVSLYIFRLLPVQFGFHTLFGILLLAFLNYKVNKINLIKSIEVSYLNYILLFVSEVILALVLQFIFKVDLVKIFEDPIIKTLLGIPSLIIFMVFVYIIHIFQKLHNRKLF